ncbi:MAG: glycolate oxidase subunit GlcF, partial [Acidiferrobacterales bacterium]
LMQTRLVDSIKQTEAGKQADEILRRCVHCGFCNATCPTFQVTGDELDGPRGRIYLIKQALEGGRLGKETQLHLDRCLQCRACETTCPSGVQYSTLLRVGQKIINKKLGRPFFARTLRKLLCFVFLRPGLFKFFLRTGQFFKPLMPGKLGRKIPRRQNIQIITKTNKHKRNVILLDGCVQQSATPATNAATIRVLDHLGIRTVRVPNVKCCAAIPAHLDAPDQARLMIKHNIDAWWPLIDDNTEAILSTASGCGLMISEYADYLVGDAEYLDKAKKIKLLNKDLSEILTAENISKKIITKKNKFVSYHAPCTQQHGLAINGLVESILKAAGYRLTTIHDSHLCCGSAGTYSITQPALSQTLLNNKIQNLTIDQPEMVATANVGCQLHLQTATKLPVVHWVELIEPILTH